MGYEFRKRLLSSEAVCAQDIWIKTTLRREDVVPLIVPKVVASCQD